MVKIKRSRPDRRLSWISMAMSFVLLFSLMISVAAQTVEAKSSRQAVITDVGGDVTVQAAGGSTAYEAYTNMGLNQGDLIVTGADSYAVLKIKDSDDEVTIGADSEVYISELAKKGSGKTSKLKMWAGSLWSSVKKLATDEDEMEVETPTAVMAVRGTHFFVNTNPFTGRTTMVVAAGVVRASTVTNTDDGSQSKGVQEQKSVLVYPSQQIDLTKRDEVKDLRTKVDVINVEQLAKQAPPKVLETIIKNKAEIDKENAEFLEKQKQALLNGAAKPPEGTLLIKDNTDLARVQKNLDNLVGNVAKQAVDEKKIEQKRAEQLADEVNRNIADPNKKLDLQNVEAIDKNAGVDPEVEKLKEQQLQALEAERKRQEQEALRQQQELEARLAAILKQAEAEKRRLEELNKKALEELQKLAEEKFTSQLTEEEKVKFEQAKKQTESTPTPTPTPTATPTPTPVTSPVNSAPTVAWTKPATASLYVGETVALEANASDADGSIAKLEFYVNGSKLAQSTWKPLNAGTYTLKVVATDDKGATAEASKSIEVRVNEGPVTAITNPVEGNKVEVGEATGITATAVDVDGISKLELFINGVSRMTSSASPLQYSWTPAAAGTYNLMVEATDAKGVKSTVARQVTADLNAGPVTSISNPTGVFEKDTVVLTASAEDPDGVSKLEFYINDALVATDPSFPYQYSWTPATPGTYKLKAKAYDSKGNTGLSTEYTLDVLANLLPEVLLISPTSDTATVGQPVTVTVDATDANGIKQVQALAGTEEIGVKTVPDASNPSRYTFTWVPSAAGVYTLTVNAADHKDGTQTVTKSIRVDAVQTNQPPAVQLDSLTPSLFYKGSLTSLKAAAADADGTIQSVDYYLSSTTMPLTKIATGLKTGTGDVYTASWTPNVAPGAYTLTVKATDDKGASSTVTKLVDLASDIAFWAEPGSVTGSAFLRVSFGALDARAVQLHFTEEDTVPMNYSGQAPVSQAFLTGHVSELNHYINTAGDLHEYVFAALLTSGSAKGNNQEVFKILAHSGWDNLKLAYIKIVMEDGSIIELEPNATVQPIPAS